MSSPFHSCMRHYAPLHFVTHYGFLSRQAAPRTCALWARVFISGVTPLPNPPGSGLGQPSTRTMLHAVQRLLTSGAFSGQVSPDDFLHDALHFGDISQSLIGKPAVYGCP